MTIGVATTTTSYKCNGREEIAWLMNADDMAEEAGKVDQQLEWFVAVEQDARKDAPFDDLFTEMHSLYQRDTIWRFQLDDEATETTSENRLMRICLGRNLAHEWAMRRGHTHLLFLDTDITPEADCIPKLLELKHPVTGGFVPEYGNICNGPRLVPFKTEQHLLTRIPRDRSKFPPNNDGALAHKAEEEYCNENPLEEMPEDWPVNADVHEHWNTAGFRMLERQVFRQVAWHYDLDDGMTDDPAFQRATARLFGQTWVRHDLLGHHVPGASGCETHSRREIIR